MKKVLPKHLLTKKKPVKKRQKSAQRPARRVSTTANAKKAVKKKCRHCGNDEVPGHQCKTEEAPPPKRRMVGIRTYYNLSGKKVHDQQTQTPVEFYPKIIQIRAENEALMNKSRSVSPSSQLRNNRVSEASLQASAKQDPLRESNKPADAATAEKKAGSVVTRDQNKRDASPGSSRHGLRSIRSFNPIEPAHNSMLGSRKKPRAP